MSPNCFLLPFLFLFFLSSSVQADLKAIPNDRYGCPSYVCGGKEVSYPFWVRNRSANSTSFCGYPKFELTCEDGKTSFTNISGNYTVTSINASSKTLTLVDSDVVGKICPRTLHNVSFGDINLTSVHSTIYLVFCYNSTIGNRPPKVVGVPVSPIDCLEWPSSYVFETAYVDSPKWDGACPGGFAWFPVSRDDVSDENLSRFFEEAMYNGFEVTWEDVQTSPSCVSCERSGGHCGYHNKTREGLDDFQCFCENGIHPNGDCHGDRKSKTVLKIGLAVGGVFLGLAIAGCGGFVYRKHRKMKGSMSSTLFRSGSLANSSFDNDPESFDGCYHKTHIFSYEELQEATGDFDPDHELGDGGFGVVFKGKLKDGRIVAVKRLYERNYRRVKQFQNEVEILNGLRHRNLVALYGCTSSRETQDLLLVYEYIPNGTVADHLHGDLAHQRALTWPLRMTIAIEAADALAYLHAHHPQIIHRDVKTSNILLDHNYTVKVADFGLSRLFPLHVTHVSTAPQGTPGYVDPEYHQCYHLTDKSDVYSFGVVLAELISSKSAVDVTRPRSDINLSNVAIDRIPKGLVGEFVDPALGFDSDPNVRRMVEQVAEVTFRCLQLERDMRPTMEEVRETLKDIAGLGDCAINGGGGRNASDDACLLKNSPLSLSPTGVADKWLSSRSTTPQTSA